MHVWKAQPVDTQCIMTSHKVWKWRGSDSYIAKWMITFAIIHNSGWGGHEPWIQSVSRRVGRVLVLQVRVKVSMLNICWGASQQAECEGLVGVSRCFSQSWAFLSWHFPESPAWHSKVQNAFLIRWLMIKILTWLSFGVVCTKYNE